MNIAFVSYPDPIAGGVMRYVSNVAIGLRKIGVSFTFVPIERRSMKTYKNYQAFGVNTDELVHIQNDDELVRYLDSQDILIYTRPYCYFDISEYKRFPDVLPWWHEITLRTKTKSIAFIHGTYCYEKFSPWLGIFEDRSQAFIANKQKLAEMYNEARGYVDCYVLPIPIACDEYYPPEYMQKQLRIVSTARIDSLKRQLPIVHAMHWLSSWALKMHYSEGNYFTLMQLRDLSKELHNVDFIKHNEAFSQDSLDNIYRHAALVYNSTKFPEGFGGGMECVTMEGAIRGAVPILTEEWIAPWAGSPGLDACYKFSIMGAHLNSVESNLVDIIKDINPKSQEYVQKQANIIKFVKENNRDTDIAKDFYKILRDL